MRFTLRPPQGTSTYYKITQGRRWVGRVYKDTSGRWHGRIGTHESGPRNSPTNAFEQVAALAMGFSSVEGVRANNRAVRRQQQANRSRAYRDLQEFIRSGGRSLLEPQGAETGRYSSSYPNVEDVPRRPARSQPTATDQEEEENNIPSSFARQREADHIDGYDRDDLGESPDY